MDAKKSTYCEVVRGGASVMQADQIDLKYIKPTVDKGVHRGNISKEALKEAGEGWSNCVILYVIWWTPFFKTFEAFTKRVRKTNKKFKVQLTERVVFL